MPWQQLFYTIALIVAAITSGGLAVYIWQRRHTPGAMSIVVLMAAASLWSLAYALQLASEKLASEVFFAKVEYFGIVVIPVAGLAFALQYSGRGRWLRPRNIMLLSVIPIITLILVWTNGAHELIWRNVRLENINGFSVKVSEYGAWFDIFFAYAYLLMLIGTSLIITMIIVSHDIYRRQAAALLIFALCPMICNTLYVLGLNPFPYLDLTPFAFNISGLVLAWGLFRFRLADLIPVAYSAIIESMNDSIIVLDSQDRIIELNPAGKRLVEKSRSNLIGQPLEKAMPELANKLDLSRLDPSRDDAPPSVEVTLGEAGSQRVYDARMSRSADQLGRLTCKVIALRETTLQKQAERKVKEQYSFLKTVLESLTHPFYVVNVEDYTVELANSAARCDDPIEGLTCHVLGHRRDRPCNPTEYPCPLEQVKKTKKAVTMEHLHYDSDGSSRHYEVQGYPVFDDDGNVVQMIEYCLDITERKRMEEEVRASEERYRSIFDNIIDAYGEVAMDGTILEVSPSIKEIAGYSREELLGKSLLDYYVEPEGRDEALEELLQKGKAKDWEFQFRRKDGRVVTFSFNIELITDEDGTPIKSVGVMRDVTERKRMEEQLRASEEKYRNIFESIIDVYGEVALDGTILEASPSIQEIGGYSREEIIGKSLLDYHVNPESRGEVIEELLEKGSVKEWEFLLRHKDGHIITFSFNVELVKDENGIPIKTRGIMRDITERKRMEEELRKHRDTLEKSVRERTAELQKAVDQLNQEISERKKTEEKYRALIDVTGDNVYELDQNFVYTYMSPMSAKLTGYTPEEHIGKTIFDFAPSDEAERLSVAVKDIMASGQPLRDFESIALHKDGRTIFLESSGLPLTDGEGNVSGYIVIDRDITEKKRMEEDLRLSEEKYRSMFWEAPDIFFILDLKTMVITDANKYALESLEYGREMLGKIDITQIVHPDDLEGASKRLSDMVTNKDRMPNFPLRVVTRTGKIRHIEQSGIVFWDEEGNAKSFMGLAHDVTERKAAEEERRLAEERYRRILDTSHDMISIIDENVNLLFANNAVYENTGYSPEDVEIMGDFDSIHPDDRERVARAFISVLNGEPARGFEYRGIHKNGETRWVESNADLIHWDEGQKAVVNVLRDITERKQAEEEIRLSKERYERILNSSYDNIFVFDESGTGLYANRAWYEDTGYTSDEVIGKNVFNIIHPDDFGEVEQVILKMLAGEAVRNTQYRRISKNGDVRWIESSAGPIDWPGTDNAMVSVTRDFTERRQAETALKNSLSLLNATLESTADGILVTDLKGNITSFNRRLLEMWKIPEHIAASGDERRVLSFARRQLADSEEFIGIVEETQQQPDNEGFEIIIFKDGRIFEQHSRPQRVGDDIVGQVLSYRDITDRRRMEEELQKSEEKYRSVFEQAADSILLVDAHTGAIVDFNRKAHENLAYTHEEFERIKMPDIEALESKEEIKEHIRRVREIGEDIFETKHRTKLGEIRDVHVNCRLVTTGDQPIFQSIWRDITDQKRAEDDLRKSREELRELSLHLETLREEERTNIAREIHDELGQALTALKMDAFWLAKRLPEDEDALVDKIKTMSNLINTTIQSMKRISTELRPGLLDDLGLASAIEWQAEEFQEHMEIECRTTIVPKDLSPDRKRATALFRIFQEALTNVGRHAKATKVTAKLEEIDGQLKLTVKDNGKGIAKSEMEKAGTFGLVGIRERVTALKGEMKISGKRGKGTTMTVIVPAQDNAESQ